MVFPADEGPPESELHQHIQLPFIICRANTVHYTQMVLQSDA